MIYPFFKRAFDILFSLSFLLFFSPLYLLLAIVIKCTSPGPIFYVGKRLGCGGKHITVYKFRTMFIDAEEKLEKLLSQNSKMQKEWDFYQKLQNDPRCTPIGKMMRKTSLDEFPQFICVLKGDLSVVGPRPHYIDELEKNKNSPLRVHAKTVLAVKPGITSIWQTSGRSNLSYAERIALDCEYVRKQSFFYDLYLVIKTVPSLLFNRGAC